MNIEVLVSGMKTKGKPLKAYIPEEKYGKEDAADAVWQDADGKGSPVEGEGFEEGSPEEEGEGLLDEIATEGVEFVKEKYGIGVDGKPKKSPAGRKPNPHARIDGKYIRPERRAEKHLVALIARDASPPTPQRTAVNLSVAEILSSTRFEPLSEMVKLYKQDSTPTAVRFQILRELAAYLFAKKGADTQATGMNVQFNIKVD